MTRGKKVTIAIFLLIAAALGIAIFIIFRPKKGTTDEGPLAGFKVMNLPRTDVEIGAPWTQGIGPVKRSSGIARVQSRSLKSSEIESAQTFDASVAASVLRTLNISSSGSISQKEKMKLKGLSIVTVGDAASLSSIAGNAYLWEAVRADDFSLTVSKADAANVRAKVKDLTDASAVRGESAGTDSEEITVSGSKLFVAYRVVSISQPTLQNVDETTISNPSATVDLGKEYQLNFALSKPSQKLFDKNCAVRIDIVSFLQLTPDSKPTVRSDQIKCGTGSDLSFPIGSVSGSQRATIDSLRMNDFKVWPRDEKTANFIGRLVVERRTMSLETLKKPDAPGW
jgi:hypothetical protein